MSERFDEIVEYLKWLTCWTRHASDQADAKVRRVNRLIRQVAEAGWVNNLAILGPVIHHWAYEPRPWGWDSGPLAQAALLVPDSIGVVIWDSEDYAQLCRVPDGLEAEAKARFAPFEECGPAVKGLLFPTIEPLLEQLYDQLP